MKAKTTDSYAELDPVFVGRKEELKRFNYKYEDFKKHYPDNNINIINYYGIGGIGKTSLLNHIQDILNQNNEKYYFVDLKNNTNPSLILKNASISLARAYDFEFPKFDLAMLAYLRRTLSVTEHAEIESFIGRSKLLSLLFDASSFIPSETLALTTSIIKLADSTITYVRNIFDDDPKTAVQKIESLSTDELIKRLPAYFAADMRENIKKLNDPFFFLIDTFENLVDEVETKGHTAYYDNWLRGDNGLIQNMPNCLWIIAGREELKWDQENKDWKTAIHKYELHDFSEEETLELLNAQNVASDNIKKAIYKLTNGTPFYVDTCVRRYYSLLDRNEIVTPEKFGHDKDELMERYTRDYDLETKQIIYVLSFVQSFSRDKAQTILEKVIPNYSRERFQKLLNLSVISVDNNDNYYIQNTISQIFRTNCDEDLYQKILNQLGAYYLEEKQYSDFLTLYERKILTNKENQNALEAIADELNRKFNHVLPKYIFSHSYDANFYYQNQKYLGLLPISLVLAKYSDTNNEDIVTFVEQITDKIITEKYQNFKYLVEYHYNYSNATLINYYRSITPISKQKKDYYKTLIRCESLSGTPESITETVNQAWAEITNQSDRFDILQYAKLSATFKPFVEQLDLSSDNFDSTSRFACAAFLAFLFTGNRYDLFTVDKAFIDYSECKKYLDICEKLLQNNAQSSFNDYATFMMAKITYSRNSQIEHSEIKKFTTDFIEKLRALPDSSAEKLTYLVQSFNLADDGFLDIPSGSINFTYINEDHCPLKDVTLRVYDADGHFLAEVVTDEQGKASVILNVLYGMHYLYKSISTPKYYRDANYVNDPYLYHFYLSPEQPDLHTTVTLAYPKGGIAFQLLDQNELPIPNQIIKIRKANGDEIVELKTNENGQAGARNLPCGQYSYQFLTATDKSEHQFEIESDKQVIIKDLIDEKLTGKAFHESPKAKKRSLLRHKK